MSDFKEENLTTAIRVSSDLKDRVDKYAKEEGISSSEFYRKAADLLFSALEKVKEADARFPAWQPRGNPPEPHYKVTLSEIEATVANRLDFYESMMDTLHHLGGAVPGNSGNTPAEVFSTALIDHITFRRSLRAFERIAGVRFKQAPFVGFFAPGNSVQQWYILYHFFLMAHLELLLQVSDPRRPLTEAQKEEIRQTLDSWAGRIDYIDRDKEKIEEQFRQGTLFPLEEDVYSEEAFQEEQERLRRDFQR